MHPYAALPAVAPTPFARLNFTDTTFETFDTSTKERVDSLARCREFAAQVNQHGCGFALLVGGPGTGKTRLACNVVRVLENRDALYIRQGELTCELRATYGRKDVFLHRSRRQENDDEDGGDDPPSPLEIVRKVRFLVLDEIGCTALANDERLLLDELLKHRYEQRKPTILISNLALDVLQEFLGDAPYDRIRHASGGGKFILQFNGESYRRGSGENYLWGTRLIFQHRPRRTGAPARSRRERVTKWRKRVVTRHGSIPMRDGANSHHHAR